MAQMNLEGDALRPGEAVSFPTFGGGYSIVPPPPPSFNESPVRVRTVETESAPSTYTPKPMPYVQQPAPDTLPTSEPVALIHIAPPADMDVIAPISERFTPRLPLPKSDPVPVPKSAVDPVALMPPLVSIPVAVAQSMSPVGNAPSAPDASPLEATGKVASDGLFSTGMIIALVLAFVLMFGEG